LFGERAGGRAQDPVIKSHVTDHFEWDDALPGFGIRVQNGGRASYVVQYKIGTKEKRRSLGKVDKVALSAAQKEAKATSSQSPRRSTRP
jgi:hypothetical protein